MAVLTRGEAASPAADLDKARYWTLAPAAVGEIVDALETLAQLNDFKPDAILRGRAADGDHPLPVRFRRWVDSTQGLATLKGAALGGSLILVAARRSRKAQIAGATLVFASRYLSELRNPYGRDGSDQMAGLIAGYRVATSLVPSPTASDDLFLRAVNMQAATSYTMSGLAKLVSSTWLSGDALELILRTRQFGQSAISQFLRGRPRLARLVTFGTIVWEVSFCAVYFIPPRLANAVLNGVKGFHVGIAATMGLPRFMWGFAASHSAVAYVIRTRTGE